MRSGLNEKLLWGFIPETSVITSLQGLSTERQGCIFLTHGNNELHLIASKNMSEQNSTCCKVVSFGNCCCGKTALTQLIEFAPSHSCNHDTNCEGFKAHGHYCAPIIDKGKTIGLINIFIEENHTYSLEEENFLTTVSNTFVGIIARKQAEERLLKSYDEMEFLVKSRTSQLVLVNNQLQRDIEDKRAQEEKLRYSENLNMSTIDAINDMIAVIDNGLRIILSNKKWRNICQQFFNFNDVFSKRIELVLPFLDANRIAEIQSIFTNSHTVQFEEEITINDALINLEIRAIPVVSGISVVRVVILIHNITQQKNAETEIRLNLDREIELNMLKSRFVSVVSHEFRTPLAGIQSSIQLLEKFGNKWDEEKKSKLIKGIYSSIQYTNLLLDDVSFVNIDDSKRLQKIIAELNVFDVCQQSINDIESLYKKAKIEFTIQSKTVSINSDESLLRHILNNILSNAIKYSEYDHVVLFNVITENNQLIFYIIDSGRGISEEDLKYIYEPFHRATNVNGIKGTGLGLTIVKRCIDLLNGSIEIKSKINIGTEVKITLPMK